MTKEEAKEILREVHEKSVFSVRTALETFFPEFKISEEELRRKHGLITLSELDEILKELHRHMDEALPEFDCRKPCPKKEENK